MASFGGPFFFMTLLTKRSDALAAGHKTYMTGKPCKHGHIAPRRVASKNCTECQSRRQQKNYQSNKDYYAEKRDKWQAANPERARELKRSSDRKCYYEQHSVKKAQAAMRASTRDRQTRKTPINKIERLMIQYRYEDAQRLTAETGVEHHVDHIWPLSKGGPHLSWNLQVLTAKENLSRSDKI